MPLVKVTSKRQITIPSALGKELGIEGGDHVEIIREGSYLVVKPVAVVDKEDAWFHSREWQAKEREADRDIAEGRLSDPIETAAQLKAHLKKLKK